MDKPTKDEKISNRIIGIVLMIAGIGIWSIDYLTIKAFSVIGYWIAELMGAPAGVGLGITILISLFYLVLLILIAIAGAFVFWFGVRIFSD